MTIKLDRIELDDVGTNPERLAAGIHAQLGNVCEPIDVPKIARAVDIIEIRSEPLTNFEGALVTQPVRSYGSILVNSNSSRKRQRFTIAHELLHFLNPWHRPSSQTGFWCTKKDMNFGDTTQQIQHQRQEVEANRFAAELLAPSMLLKPHLAGLPDLQDIVDIASRFDISKQAAARRYMELHPADTAIIVCKSGRFAFYDARSSFPSLRLKQDQALPDLPTARGSNLMSERQQVEASDWLARPKGTSLVAQTLRQQDGYAMVLLTCELEDEDEEIEDIADRFRSFSRDD